MLLPLVLDLTPPVNSLLTNGVWKKLGWECDRAGGIRASSASPRGVSGWIWVFGSWEWGVGSSDLGFFREFPCPAQARLHGFGAQSSSWSRGTWGTPNSSFGARLERSSPVLVSLGPGQGHPAPGARPCARWRSPALPTPGRGFDSPRN